MITLKSLLTERWYLGVACFWCMVWLIPALVTIEGLIPFSDNFRTFLMLSNFLQLPLIALLGAGVLIVVHEEKDESCKIRRQIKDQMDRIEELLIH